MTIGADSQSVAIEPLCSRLVKAAAVLGDCENSSRKERRNTLTLPCQVLPIDENCKPNGKAFSAITTDISANGISILYTESVEPQLIQITVIKSPAKQIRFLADIVRCGSVNGYYKIGAKLIQRES